MLAATGQLHAERVQDFAIIGELALDGSVRPVKGALSMAMAAAQRGLQQAAGADRQRRGSRRRRELDRLRRRFPGRGGRHPVGPAGGRADGHRPGRTVRPACSNYDVDFADVRGQEFAKRALVVAAAGGHNVLMIGSPGTGKTMLAQRLPTILPPLTLAESLETTRIYSAMGRLPPRQPLLATRPFRSPHHTISDAGMVGGGSTPDARRDQPGPSWRPVSSTNCPSSTAAVWKCCVSRWKRAR